MRTSGPSIGEVLTSAAGDMTKAQAIAKESARHNLGMPRTINVPTAPLEIIHPIAPPGSSLRAAGRRDGPRHQDRADRVHRNRAPDPRARAIRPEPGQQRAHLGGTDVGNGVARGMDLSGGESANRRPTGTAASRGL